jgi:hypothetical protein
MATKVLRKVNPARALTFNQKQAVYRAHIVGSGQLGADGKTPARAGNYTWRQLRRKVRILKKAKFKKAERRLLIKKGVVGSREQLPTWIQRLADDVARGYRPQTREEYDSITHSIGVMRMRPGMGRDPTLMGLLGRVKEVETRFYD